MRILIVEDEALIAMMLQEWLVELGCSVLGPAATVASARSLIKQEMPDAAILDLSLRGEESYTVRDDLTRLGIPVVIATGRILQASDALTLVKPYDFEAVRAVVDNLKSKSRAS